MQRMSDVVDGDRRTPTKPSHSITSSGSPSERVSACRNPPVSGSS
jgi:hypothetical protein